MWKGGVTTTGQGDGGGDGVTHFLFYMLDWATTEHQLKKKMITKT